jgi:hypothetical protein
MISHWLGCGRSWTGNLGYWARSSGNWLGCHRWCSGRWCGFPTYVDIPDTACTGQGVQDTVLAVVDASVDIPDTGQGVEAGLDLPGIG